jgi:hypothetical protein
LSAVHCREVFSGYFLATSLAYNAIEPREIGALKLGCAGIAALLSRLPE